VTSLAQKNKNVSVIDITDSEKYFNSSAEYWADGVHLSPQGADIVLQNIKAQGL